MAPQAGQQALARDWIPLLICKSFVELRGFEPLTPSMPWRCATSCATAPRGLGTDKPGPKDRTLENRTSTVERSYPVAATTSPCLAYGTATELRLARMACFCSLPEAVRARDTANETPAGHLKWARRSRVQAMSSASDTCAPGRRTTTA